MNFVCKITSKIHLRGVKDKIKNWLKRENRTRAWLGEQVGVSKKAVDNWLSSPKEIPLGKIKLIEKLMAEDAARETAERQRLHPQSQIYSLELDLPTFRLFSRAAAHQGQTIEDWSVQELENAARMWERAQIEKSLDAELGSQEDEPPEEPIPDIDTDPWDRHPRASSGIAMLAEGEESTSCILTDEP